MTKSAWPKVTKRSRPNQPDVWLVDARIKGKGKRLSCKTKEEARTLADQLRIKRANAGSSAFEMPDNERIDAQTALDLLRPHGLSLQEAAGFLLKHRHIVVRNISLKEAAEEIVAAKTQDGFCRRYINVLRSVYARFQRAHPGARILDVDSAMIDRWLRSLSVGPYSRNDYRMVLCTLFSFCVQRKYVLANPVTEVSVAKIPPREAGILTVAQCVALLEACTEEILPAVAVSLFAGLRPESEMMRLDWEHIDFESGLIDIAAHRTKSAKKRFVTIQPNLVEWLLPYRKKSGFIFAPARCFSSYILRQQDARAKAGITLWRQDVLRHTFGSMHYAQFRNVGETAQEMGHRNNSMIYKHYRERVKPAEASAFWNIQPGRRDNIVPMIGGDVLLDVDAEEVPPASRTA